MKLGRDHEDILAEIAANNALSRALTALLDVCVTARASAVENMAYSCHDDLVQLGIRKAELEGAKKVRADVTIYLRKLREKRGETL